MKDRYLKRMYLVAESGKDEIREQVKRLAGKLMRQGLEVQLTTPEEKQTDIPAAEGSLCLTDSSELVKELMRQRKPVIAWLHEGNRGKDFGEVLYAVEEPEELAVLASGERIDGVVSKVYNMSRSDSLSMFREKKVYVNGRLCENNSRLLKSGETVNVRGYGKFIFEGVNYETKKGKLSLKVKVFR